jgi:glycogen(starch) synthase
MAKSTTKATEAPPPSPDDLDVPRRGRMGDPLLVEVAWEVVNQVGGIYTVIRSKLPAMMQKWDRRCCLIGPYMPATASVEFEEAPLTGPFGQAVKQLREEGIGVHYGHWLVSGKPRVVLLDLGTAYDRLPGVRERMWNDHGIGVPEGDRLTGDVVLFGHLVQKFLTHLGRLEAHRRPIIAHFHEWMGGAAIPEVRRQGIPVTTVFTTHATMLGRYVAANDPWYYDHVPFVNWETDAKRFNIEPQVRIERAAAHGAHVFTTVSQVTAFECQHLLGRAVDLVTPNGLNIERFTALHEFQDLHRRYKEKIHEFVMGHFFPSYSFDLDRTLYFFTSGRYEYSNKGFDMTVEALARLNHRMKEAKINRTVVFFIVTKQPYHRISSEVLQARAVMNELREACDAIKDQIGDKLFYAVAHGRAVRLDDLLDDYWRLRLRRTVQAWKTGRWPSVVTHDLVNDSKDELLAQIRNSNLINNPDDPVKIVYHPDFISASNPLWGMDYDQFVRGCHAGIFPSFYEPWGYTPLECIARGIPAVSSDVSGFGSYVMEHFPQHDEYGMYVLRRRYASFNDAANQLTDVMFRMVSLGRRDRIEQRNKVDRAAEHFDWNNLIRYYDQAHDLALSRLG